MKHVHALPDELREPHTAEIPGVWRLYFIGLGVAIALGLIGGGFWIVWRLLVAQFFVS